MQHPFEALKPEYTALLSQMRITRQPEVDATAKRLLGYVEAGRYRFGCQQTGVPIVVAAASFEREAGSNFRLNPAQGWPLDSRSRNVPYNGPFADWTTAQIAAYKIDGLDKVGAANWSWEIGCYEEEGFNGFGPRAHGKHTGYLWAGTSIYTGGKYVADGVWDPNAVDKQLGVVPIMLRMVQMDASLALPFPFPAVVTTTPAPVAAPQMPPVGVHSAAALHVAMNKLLHLDPPFPANDDNYDRFTKAAVAAFQKKAGFTGNDVDGLAGPKTWAAIDRDLAA
jgi:lysozyme family protein